MKIKLKHSTHGSVLLVTLLTATIIGIALASYLALVSNQNLSVTRSLAWNSVMPVVESGVEEALSQIFYNSYTNLSANSWTLSATDGLYHKTRTVGTDGSYYEVSISPVDPPVIVSKGYVVPPVRDYSQLGMILATAVGGSPSGATPTYVCRTVQVKTQKMRGSGVGLTAKDFISFSGGSLDSYSSADGPYNATNHHAGGKAVSNSKLANAIQVGTAHIYGSASTG